MSIFSKWRPRMLVAIAVFISPIIAGLIEYFLTDGVSGWIPLVAGLGGALVTVAFLWFAGRRSAEDKDRSEEQVLTSLEPSKPLQSPYPIVSLSEDKILSLRTPSELLKLVKGQTEIGARHAAEPHIGYWLRVNGSVLNVLEYSLGNILTVYMRDSQSGETVFLDFENEVWGARVRPLTTRDKISAAGKIKKIATTGYIKLEECEILN